MIVWRAGLEALGGEFDAARDAVERARHTYIELWQPVTAAVSCDQIGGLVEMLAGEYEAAEGIFRGRRGGVPAARRVGSPDEPCLGARRSALRSESGTKKRTSRLRVALEHSDSDDISAEFTWRSIRAKVLAQAGNHDAAEELISRALTLVDLTDCLNQRANVRLDHASVLQLPGRGDAAADAASARGLALRGEGQHDLR